MNPIVEKVYQIGIIPVIAFNSVDEALPLCKALAEGGLPAAEVTFRTACAEECIRKIHEEMPEMLLGAGTVLTTEQADRAMAAGASFIVAPGFDPEVCQHVIDKGGIMMPPLSMTCWQTSGSKPGATMKDAPAAIARSACSVVSTVPAPSSISGISSWILRMHSSAHAVRKVTSAAGRPPSARALHRGRASSTLLKAITGIMPI